jgi:hypothetical protein
LGCLWEDLEEALEMRRAYRPPPHLRVIHLPRLSALDVLDSESSRHCSFYFFTFFIRSSFFVLLPFVCAKYNVDRLTEISEIQSRNILHLNQIQRTFGECPYKVPIHYTNGRIHIEVLPYPSAHGNIPATPLVRATGNGKQEAGI